LSRRAFLAGAAGFVAAGPILARAQAQRRTVNTRFDLDRFIDEVKRARKETDSQTAVQEVLQRAVSEPSAVLAGLGEPTDVGINTLYRADDLTVLNVVWAPLMVLLPHNHNMWASIGIYTGREDNIVWQRRGGVIEAAGAEALSEKETFGLPGDAIHSVTNPIGKLTGAIHIYGGDFFAAGRSEWDAETLRERPFDIERARQVFIDANERFKATR
jgi:predicted metal-dependent enzyme (double-stranded beta helix superfamily)